MIHRFVMHNGRICESGETLLRPGQLGLLAGWGIFSTLRIAEGVLFAWERHWARLSRDSKLMNVPLPTDSEIVRRDLLKLIEANNASNGTLRLVIVRNGGVLWEDGKSALKSDVIAMTADQNRWGAGVRLMYQPAGRFSASDFCRAKVTSWSANLRWYERAHDLGYDECILLNENGHITECTSANIFAVAGSKVWTAPIESGCLPGITREVLLTAISVPGVQLGEKVLTPPEIEAADEVFITSSTRDLLPVSRIGERALQSRDHVRPVLLDAFRRYLSDYVTRNRELYGSPVEKAGVPE